MGMVTLPRVPELVDLMQQAAESTGREERAAILAKAQQVWVDQVFTMDLFVFDASKLIAPWVTNYKLSDFPSGRLMLQPGLEAIELEKSR